MGSRRKREEFDELLSRVLLFLLGSALIAVVAGVLYREGSDSEPAVAIGFVLMTIASPLIFVSIFGSKIRAQKWANNTGSHEILILFFLIAWAISYLLKKALRKT
ncbi:hypothetical protein [Microbulbifer variabilis]|uniref:hypothetical protein n=1 Tax=Microbulbifer variabilis TaxID=266805 RepID=UPI001CFEEB25|nr:hypothetical protein [Microbulbifer variabilis]